MAGYQEVLTDPSYAGQIVTMTAPQQGNYGVNPDDDESARIRVAGFAVREASRRASNWRATGTLANELERAGVVGIEGIDTRRLTRRIREAGAMRAAISTRDLSPGSLGGRVQGSPGMSGADLARTVSAKEPFAGSDLVGPAATDLGPVLRVAAYDLGMKRSILRQLAGTGIETTVFPAQTPALEIAGDGFDGVFLSNGPGDPDATGYGIAATRELLGKLPVFGICLGHQLLGLALGGATYKMRFGHRGVNQPVKDLSTGAVEITSHNHGFAVDPRGWDRLRSGRRSEPRPLDPSAEPFDPPSEPPVIRTKLGAVELTHWNLNDGTLEGMRCLEIPAFSVQYHPEAAPGPHDSRHLFQRFRELMVQA